MADRQLLYGRAQQFYWDLKTLAEGLERAYVDRKKLEDLEHQIEATQLSEEQMETLERGVSEEIRMGSLPEDCKAERLTELIEECIFSIKFARRNAASRACQKWIRIPGEPGIVAQVLGATKPEEIVEICRDVFSVRRDEIEPGVFTETPVPNWPISGNSELPKYLCQCAAEFIDAKNDPRFPRSSRPTNRLKQFWFLSRALAGAVYGITPRTAINIIGSIRPDEMFESQSAKRKRKAKKSPRKRS